ncbi:hypothetical protein [Gilliamella sp. ESL0250]|uniref:hypothetical protein n=1 Tax=Gilliamella sp. ESL0250 TaxID=2705036 RepID=UPI0015812CD7|nr:hypothetical protein [Gilliamella sp. ESL0250]NUF48678.1 hypothetical protein [Gilliamella sp. ESL0250]
MKALKAVVFVLTTTLILVGCDKKNEEYFLNNIDAANKKMEQCNKDFKKAFMANDEKGIKKVEEDTECRAAETAIKKDKKLKYELEKKRKEEEKKQAIESEMSTINKQLMGLSWNDSVNEYLKVEECQNRLTFTQRENPKCEAWKTIYNEKVDEGIKELKQLSFDELKLKMQSLCKLDKRTNSNCSIAQKALEEKAADELTNADIQTIEAKKSLYCADDIAQLSVCRSSWEKAWKNESDKFVKLYIENNAEFINTYNSCVNKLQEIKSQELDWQEKNKLELSIKDGYPCSQVKEAYLKRGMGYSRFDKKIEE